jgi:hypothetical protein
MRSYDNALLTALAERHLKARDLVVITPRDFQSGVQVQGYYWNELGTETLQVLDPATQTPVSHDFVGAGTNLVVGVIQMSNDLSIRTINITLNNCSPAIDTLVRGYDLRRAPVQVFRGFYNKAGGALAAPAISIFDGYVDACKINTGTVAATPGEQGQPGSVEVTCVTHSKTLTRVGNGKRSSTFQQQRLATDTFHQWDSVMQEVQIFWGRSSEIVSKSPSKSGIGGSTFTR